VAGKIIKEVKDVGISKMHNILMQNIINFELCGVKTIKNVWLVKFFMKF
jgi:hypothetical protein